MRWRQVISCMTVSFTLGVTNFSLPAVMRTGVDDLVPLL